MTGISSTTTARHRRKNNTLSPWQTPLPLTQKKRAASMNSKSGTTFSTAMCFSMLCMILFFSAIFSTTFNSYSTLPAIDKNKIFGKRHASNRSSIHAKSRGRNYRHDSGTIQYVNLPEISSSSRQYDVIVVGCGPAGLTAALFASRMGMSVLVFGSPSTGSLSGTSTFDNFPSFFGQDGGGQGWIDATLDQASFFGAQFAPPMYIATGLARTTVQQQNVFEVHLGTGTSTDLSILGKTVIVASGSVPRKLNLPRETLLWGRSIHNCALCDGDAYVRNNSKKSVVVVGGGDAAVEAIFLLHSLGVDAIHWVHRREEYRTSMLDVERVRHLASVDIWTPYVVVEWMVKEKDDAGAEDNTAPLTLEGVRIVGARDGVADPEATSSLTIPCDGVFLMIGSTPNSKWLQSSGIDIDPNTKLIRLPLSVGGASSGGNENNPTTQFSTSTSMEGGVFAAGEVVDGIYRQALTASSEGAKAAIDVQRYLRRSGMDVSVPTGGEAVKHQTNDTKKKPKIDVHNESEKKDMRPTDCDLTKPDCINLVVSSHPVVVFSKNYCPHCRSALEALRTLTEPFVIEITEIKDGMKVQIALESLTGRRTVPNVFIGGKSIGGGDETVALFRAGKLGGLILKASIK